MRPALDVYKERGGTEPPTLEEMARVGMPAVVECTGCTMTMVVLSAHIDSDMQCWCATCADAFAEVEG